MKRFFLFIIVAFTGTLISFAQITKGKCGNDIVWEFDGYTLTISPNRLTKKSPTVAIPDYDTRKRRAPWVKRGLRVSRVKIGKGIRRIGSCAFANCTDMKSVEFLDANSLEEFGWGAFLNCKKLESIPIPSSTKKIETIAFANCSSLRNAEIHGGVYVHEKAFLSCTGLNSISIESNVELSRDIFSIEKFVGDQVSYQYYDGKINSLPLSVTQTNCEDYGLSKRSVAEYLEQAGSSTERNLITSEVDTVIPEYYGARNETYALIIGNQSYLNAPEVPWAKHDAQIFKKYCEKALGIPSNHIHLCVNATRYIIQNEELGDWLKNEIENKDEKNLIVYYAGHGVPNSNEEDETGSKKSYLLPTDVRDTKPQDGIALDDLYAELGDMGFNQVTVFLDACFSGLNRNDESISGERKAAVKSKKGNLSSGKVVVFSAAQDNQTAHEYKQEGHGLFTYFLLKKIQEDRGYDVSYGALFDYLKEMVNNKAEELKRKQQTPTIQWSDEWGDNWRYGSF